MTNTTVLKYEISLGTDECDFESDKEGEIKKEQALVEASAVGDLEKIVELLSSGVSVDAVEYNKLLFYASKNYMTPLQLATVNGNEACLDILIEHGADVNAKDRFDVTALHMAAEKGYLLCVMKLLDAGADCCSPTKYSKSGCYKAVPYLGGTTPLHLAAANDHVDCCKLLIQFGADYNAIDECGRTSLFIAAQAGFSACVLTHLRHAVGRDILSLPGFETNDTPLHFAVLHRMIDCVRELLNLGSDANHINIIGCSPLHIALMPLDSGMSYCRKLSKMLIFEGYNTDVNQRDSACYTPLHYVCFNCENRRWRRRPQLAKLLIMYGANVNIKNCCGSSLLHCELRSPAKNFDVLKYIVRSMLYLPRLHDLKLSPNKKSQACGEPPPLDIRTPDPNLENDILESYRQLFDPPIVLEGGPLRIPWEARSRETNSVPFTVRQFIPRNPFYELHMMRAYDAYEGRTFQNRESYVPYYSGDIDFDRNVVDKRDWYEEIASSPRTLKHCCRFSIRKALGSRKMKHVEKLPIPPSLQSYILLQSD